MPNTKTNTRRWMWPWALCLLCAVPAICAAQIVASPTKTFTVLVAFNINNGNGPLGALVQGRDGNFYGTTYYGGSNNGCGVGYQYGCGTVFKVTPSGYLTVLYSFCAETNCSDGYEPFGALTLGTDGNFYGTTVSGTSSGRGTVFKITSGGKLTTLHSFCSVSYCADGSQANGGLVEGIDGNFYGTTESEGAYGYGTVYKITPAGSLNTLYSFTGATDGANPSAGLTLGTDGNFYGTTYQGGAVDNDQCAPGGCGTVFKITPAGVLTTMVSFTGENGLFPLAPVFEGNDGNFYGTTYEGGSGINGIAFKMTADGTLGTIHYFCSLYNCNDGDNPTAGLVQATDGNFYGTTSGSDEWGSIPGTIFKITPLHGLSTLHTFCSLTNCDDGYASSVGLLQATDGNFYGVAGSGGSSTACTGGCGTIFKLASGLAPFVALVSDFGKAGSTVQILGSGFKGTTAVSFNGVSASFTEVSQTFLTATVPAGATTGLVTVATPGGTLTSNLAFHVTP